MEPVMNEVDHAQGRHRDRRHAGPDRHRRRAGPRRRASLAGPVDAVAAHPRRHRAGQIAPIRSRANRSRACCFSPPRRGCFSARQGGCRWRIRGRSPSSPSVSSSRSTAAHGGDGGCRNRRYRPSARRTGGSHSGQTGATTTPACAFAVTAGGRRHLDRDCRRPSGVRRPFLQRTPTPVTACASCR